MAAAAAQAQSLWPSRSSVTLTRPASPEKGPDSDGFIQRWLVLEPIESNGLTDSAVQAAVKKEYFPNQFTLVPRDGDKVTAGDAQAHLACRRHQALQRKPLSLCPRTGQADVQRSVLGCDRCQLRRDEMSGVRLAIGSNAASVWWVNGQEVIGIYGDRQTVIDDGVSKRLTLKKGTNIVRAAIVNGGGATDFCARFLDDQDQPLKGFTVSLTSSSTTKGSVK